MESQRYVTKHQFTHHFCSRDFAIPMKDGSVCGRGVYPSIWTWYQQLPYRRTSLFFMFCKSSRRRRRKSHVGRWLLRLLFRLQVSGWLSSVWLSRVRARGSFCIERATAYPTPDANKAAHHSLLFCLPVHTTPPFTTYRHLTLHTLLAPPIHSLHLLAFFFSAATSTSIKCLQTPRSNHE